MVLSTRTRVSRLAIFVFYDREGIVDDYVCDILKKLERVTEQIVLISNGNLQATEKAKLEPYAKEIYERENYGLDAAAYKKGLIEYVGREKAQTYDEIILINDTFYGPFYGFDPIFDEMDTRDVDFWGLSYGQKSVDGWHVIPYGYTPEHIQTFFIAFRKSLLQADAFWNYWEKYDDTMNNFVDVVTKHEMIMTKYFSDLGYKWDVYANQKHYTTCIKELNFNNYYYAPYMMIKQMNFPFLKKKALMPDRTDYVYHQHGETVNKVLNHMITESEYEESYILENLLRLNNPSDLKSSLNLNFIFSKNKKQERTIDFKSEKIAIIVRLRHIEYVSIAFDYLNRIQKDISVYVIVENEYIWEEISNIQNGEREYIFLTSSGQETEMGAFVLCCEEILKKYEYICFVHDAVIKNHVMTVIKDETVVTRFENTIATNTSIEQIILYLKDNPYIGLLETPFNTFSDYFGNYKDRWHGYYDTTVSLLNQIGINANISPQKEPISIDCAFWCRSEALRPLWNRNYKAEEFICHPITEKNPLNESLQRALPYVAQSQGYFTAMVMNDEFAATEIENTSHYLRQILLTTEKIGCSAGFYAGYMQELGNVANNPANIPAAIGLRKALSYCYHKRLPKRICKIFDKIVLKRR